MTTVTVHNRFLKIINESWMHSPIKSSIHWTRNEEEVQKLALPFKEEYSQLGTLLLLLSTEKGL